MGSLKACIALFCLLFFLIESIETGEGNRTCSNDSLPCDDGECVSRGKWCDGKKNCKDESDEAYCKKKGWWTSDDPNFCEGTHFLCKIGQCIPLVGKCDGFEDCKDKSDEWKCEPETRDDYDDHLLLTTFSPIPTETTSIESTSIRDGLEKDDIETTTQSSHPIFTKVAQLETSHTEVPSSTNLSTSALKLPETVPTSSQVTITNSTSTKSLPPATHQTIPQPQTWKVDQSHVTITGATIHGSQVYRFISSDPKRYYEGYYNQYGQFVTTYSNEGQERYPRPRTEPPRRHRPPPLTISTAAPLSFDRKLKAPSRFYFAKDYTRTYLRENAVYIDLGRAWILSNRSAEGGWGSETPRALIALSLINNSFVNETYENNIMQKHFQVFLGTSLIRGDTKTTSINRLAMFVNALIATCQNPRDFHGTDYTELVRKRLREQLRNSQHRRNEVQSPNPFVCLSLCLADRDLERQEVHHLITRLQSHDSEDEFEQDENAMAILAVACHLQRHKSIYPSDSEYLRPWDSLLRNATWKLLNRMRDDGSFGSVYSTAIAAQALMSVNETRNWNPELTFNFLREHQKDDGSFGDFLATYLVLPALSGRSLLHLRNTQCTPPNSDRGQCLSDQFQCFKSKKCIPMRYVCDSDFDCGREDPSDEMNCRLTTTTPRPATCIKGYYCPNTQSCLSQTQICDGEIDCPSSPDEKDCSVTKVANVASAKLQCINWFMNRRKKNTIHKWGHQLHRTAVALYLADENFFAVDNVTGHEIRYELTIRLLSKIKSRKSLRTEQLALYVHALLVSCLNPRHFYGHDLVSDLRRRVNFSKYASPLAILALCNAGAPMYQKDVDRLREIHTSRHKPYWTEVQVLATMALSCIASRNEYVRRGDLHTWINLAKKVPLHDGNETNRRTVALVIQMMLGTEYSTGFNWTAAVEVIKDPSFVSSSNFLDKYYLTPILNNKGLTAINNKHCGTFYNYEESNMKMIVVRYTVWAKEGASLGKSWRIEISTSSTLYDVILKVQKLDSTHRVKFNVVDGKPYVKSVTGLDEDPETDYFWFTYERTVTKDLQLLEDSPVDIIVEDNDEFILWYRKGIWNDDGSGGSGEALLENL